MKVFLLVLLAVTLSVAVPTQLSYTIGTNYVYNVSGVVQNNGYDTNVEDFVPGYYSFMEGYMVMQPVKEDNVSYLFVMNIYGAVVSVSNNSAGGNAAQPGGKSLGSNMYFTQLKTGQIVQIQYYSDDPIYYVNVKLGAINAFQTSLVSVGATQTVFESDPIGNHTALITAVANSDGSLTLTKEFSQSDFSAFPDPTVSAQNMNIAAEAVTSVHPSGYISSSFLKQGAIMTSGVSRPSKRSVTNSTGFDINLSALGSLAVQFSPNTALASTVFATKVSANLITTSMFNFAATAADFAKTNAFTLSNAVDILVSKKPVPMASLIKVANHYKVNSLDDLIPVFTSDRVVADAVIRDRLFFVLTAVKNEHFLVKYGLNSRFCEVITRATLAAAHFDRTRSLQQALLAVNKQNKCSFAKDVASSVLSGAKNVKDSDFPFNKSYSGELSLGGKTVGVDFTANAFAGTNLNCNNPTFNYEASAEATASVVLFGVSQQAFDAKVVYGQENGATLADAITLAVWGNVIYNKALPVVPCEQETYPLAHVTPGFSVSHTLWVSIIPIVFSASTALDLTATWGWGVCPSQLTADVDISGDGAITVDGSTYTDLLLLRAGFDLTGSFQTNIIPTVSVQGALCQVTFEVDVNNQPLTAALTSYYEWRHCKFLFFNCDWTHYNEQSWWNWAEAAKDYVLFKMTYQIA